MGWGGMEVGAGARVTERKSTGGDSDSGAERKAEKEGGGLTFHGDFSAARQICLVAHQDDGHVVRLVCAPQLDAELRGTLEAAPVCDGVHDDVGTAHLQARLLAPAFLLQGRESEGTEALAEKGRLGWSNGWDGAEVYTLDRLGDKFCHDFLSHHGKPPILSELQFLCLKHLTNGTTSLHSLIHQFLL